MRHDQAGQGSETAFASDKAASVQREKNWIELGIEEKVERLRMALRMTNERAAQGSRTAVEALQIGRHHEHNVANQAVLVPVDNGLNNPLSISGRRESESDYVGRLLA